MGKIEEIIMKTAIAEYGGVWPDCIEDLAERSAIYARRCLLRQFPELDPNIRHTVEMLAKDISLKIAARVLDLERNGQIPRNGFGSLNGKH